MYRGQQSNTEGDDIWREKGKYRGTLQSQQLQMAAERGSLVGITAEKEVRSLKNPHFPHLVMHLSMEDMILSQSDLIWENYIVSGYKSYYSDCPSDVANANHYTLIPRDSITSGSRILYEHSTSVEEVGYYGGASYGNFTARQPCQVKDIVWTSYVQGAITKKNLWRKRKLEDTENRAKRSLSTSTCGDSLPYFMGFNKKTNIDFIFKDQDGFVKPCRNLETSSNKNPSMPLLRSAQETCCNVKPGSKMSEDGCYFGSVLKSLVISSSSLCVTEEVFSSTFIPQNDRSVDYTTLCGSLLQKGRCKVPADSDERLCLTNNTDSNINLHVRLSVHPRILTSDGILSDINSTQPGERQGQNSYNRASYQRKRLTSEMADAANTSKSSLENKSLLPCVDKKNRLCGNNMPLLPKAKPFSTQLNYPLAKQHFLRDINFSILAASLLRTSKNDFSFLHSAGLQSASQTHEMTDESFSGPKYEPAEVEVSLGTDDINNSSGTAHLDCKSALSKQGFCFPSHFKNRVDAEQSEKETSGNNVDFYVESTQVSYTESFKKICLVEAESSNSTETNCFFRDEMLSYKSKSRQDNMTTMEHKPTESESKCQDIKHHKFYIKDTKDKECNEKQLNGNINIDAVDHWSIENYSIGEKVMEGVEEGDDIEEEKQHVKFGELLNGSQVSSVCVETIGNGNSEQEGDPVNDIDTEESLVVTKKNTDGRSTDFQMKAQFDLVLEELRMFHKIEEEEKVGQAKTEYGKRLQRRHSNTRELQENKVIVGSNCEFLQVKKDYVCDTKSSAEVSEQEVPQQYVSAYQGEEESLYSADSIGDNPKSLSWTPAFQKRNDKEESVKSYTEKVTFPLGIGRVTPLKTRSGPLRIGLSKKARIKQLHPYLR
ncbi:RAD51-associated protein 2 isoform X2 [Dendropsophus ebraccatus]|uniref:RAD51-associated protein 2 isoform X2 n=1 Tax=Dendropsophus ebraccatus TaxID=150705 RepID=UPI0038318D6E